MTRPAPGSTVARPSSRPAASDETTTWSAPLCFSSGSFSDSRTAAVIASPVQSWRAVSVISTAVSSRPTAMISRAAVAISVLASTSRRVASPVTPASPAALTCMVARGSESTTTIEVAGTPASRSVVIALRPLVP